MAAKFIILSLLVASAYGSGGYSSFSYGVSDPNTGDIKDQHEKRVGDSVVGKYSLIESDGSKRIVEYEANSQTGFNAVVRKEPAEGVHGPAGPLGNGPANPAGAVAPALPAPDAPAHPAPIAPAHPGVQPNPAPLPHPGAHAHAGGFAHPGAFTHHGALSHPGALAHPGAYPRPGALADPAALAHHGALTHPGALPHPGALGHFSHPGTVNPHYNRFAGNFGQPGYGPYTGANGLGGPVSGPQGVPAVSHYSHSVVHDAPRPYFASGYNGAHGSAYNGAYGGAYNGANGGAYNAAYGGHYNSAYRGFGGVHGGYGAPGQLAAFGAPQAHGLAAPGYGIGGARGLAHSYNSLTRGEAYPHGYGGYGARIDGAYGAGAVPGVGTGLTW